MTEMKPKSGASGKGKKRASSSGELRISKDLMQRVRREAAALRLDVPEYFALIVHSSEVIRQSLLPEGLEDATVLRKVLGTPLLLDMAKTTAQAVIRNTLVEHLPNWRAKDLNPEQLIHWLREIGTKKPRQDTFPPPGQPHDPARFDGPIPGPSPWPGPRNDGFQPIEPQMPAVSAPGSEQPRTFPAIPPVYDLPWPPPERFP
jgi:hypothetical protein